MEAYDGYKHVDISISWVGLNIEIDGRHHLLNSKQLLCSDLERDYYSQDDDDIRTIQIPSSEIDTSVSKVADSIAKVARKR